MEGILHIPKTYAALRDRFYHSAILCFACRVVLGTPDWVYYLGILLGAAGLSVLLSGIIVERKRRERGLVTYSRVTNISE